MEMNRQSATRPFGHRPTFEGAFFGLATPAEVMANTMLNIAEKRALIASWVSDANAVDSQPTLRRLPNGDTIEVDELIGALTRLDEEARRPAETVDHQIAWRTAFDRQLRRLTHPWRPRRRASGRDDHDLPPCAAAAIPPRPAPGHGGGEAQVMCAIA